MTKLKPFLLLALVFMMTFSSALFGLTGISAAVNSSSVPNVTLNEGELNLPEAFVDPEDPKKQVRVIIELDKAPAIESATNKGVLYKNLPDNQKESLEAAVVSDQESVQLTIASIAPRITYLENFTTVFNGFSAEVEAGQVEEIANLNGVKAVYESTEYQRPEVQPEMKYSKALVQAQQAWTDYGYRGEGLVVGVIDTGIDPSHKDMVLTDNATGDITKSEVAALLTDKSIENGKFFTAKVPFGYNYMDGNNEILDLGPEASMHGMHVAGTVGANGNEENGGIKGVAPEAQLLALKVFGNDPLYPSTYGDIYIKAIDDSIKLGADVINMSLGSTAGFVDSSNPEQKAVERATNNGILMSISAGNSDMLGSGYSYPRADNQDYGLTGSPSTSIDSFGVASFENDMITAKSLAYQVDGTQAGRALYLLANDADPTKLPNASYEVLAAGLGKPTDFEGKDFTGKFALISRGEISFVEKGLAAQAAGAAGVIVYNNTTGTISMASDAAIKIPFMSALQADGVKMKEQLDANKKVTVVFDGEFLEIQNPDAGNMSDFTSWGPTPNLDFKPEITAPGGNIFSTLNDDSYGLMSGTSMAAPHVSGGAALMFQRIEELGLSGRERVQFAKNLLMNTADPVEFSKGQYVSPRRQGAGLMQLHDALSTDVMLTNKATGDAKVALKEIINDKFTFTLEAKNLSDKAATYDVAVNVQTDNSVKLKELNVTAPNATGSYVVTEDVAIDAPKTITVPANGTKEITVTVDVSALKGMPEYAAFINGFFVDGFVTLTDKNEEVTGNTQLVVPYFGFNGGWDDARIFDEFAWSDASFYGITQLADEAGNDITGGTHTGKFVPERFAFSPNGDELQDVAVPVYSLLRNAKNFEVNVLDAAGKKLRTIRTASDLTKHYSTSYFYTFDPLNGWDGMINGKQAKDGKYQIQLRAVIDYPNAEWQSISFPIIVDTVAPEAAASYDAATKTITVSKFADNASGVGVDRWEVYQNGEEVTENEDTQADESLAPSNTSYKLETAVKTGDELTAVFYDIAGNVTEVELMASSKEEKVAPVIFFTSPEVLEVYDQKTVEVSGTVEDDSKIVSLTVNGVKAKEFDGTNFKHNVTFKDGSQYVTVKAVDEFGNEMEIRRQILVDTTPAVISIVSAPKAVGANVSEVEVTFNVKDNMDDISAYVNGNEVFKKAMSEPYGKASFNQNIKTKVAVDKIGANNYTVLVKDAAGHETEKTFTITKAAKVTFSDIQTYWAKTQIEALASQNIIKGKTDTLFAPQENLTRAEFAVLLTRTLELPLKDYEGRFTDAGPSKTWASKEIEAAARAGIVLGLPNNTFDPKAPISRQDTAVMIMRAIEYKEASLLEGLDTTHKFADSAKIKTYASESVAQAYALGLITGRTGNIFDPQAKITRGETAAVLYRALDKMDLLK
ncbi:putative lactocepin precursor [Planococcus halocryophilus Or1]|uniref:Lactocepin n=1 Tax=Planococcus halocryophilus TaxID=1215089 RepID=A0A1C7DRR3_9BACL|nr:S8 family serine peptidase [Planococcus halocryophilus]ANU13981.1 lactocepin [Planococcus halocryophilus]EMF47421.1 putative lactocepin precursor [Planococcus halocryophilus Or1]